MKSSTAITPSATSADVVTLTIDLTREQFARLALVAKIVNTTPEKLAIVGTFEQLDGWSTWGEFAESIDDAIMRYAEAPAEASSSPLGERLEDMAPERLKRHVGYVSPAREEEPAHA